jgi:hypothetical protein
MVEEFPNTAVLFRHLHRPMPFWAVDQYQYLRTQYLHIHNSESLIDYLQSKKYKNLNRDIESLLDELRSDDYVSVVGLYYDLRRRNEVFNWFSDNRNVPTPTNPRAGYIGNFFTRPLSAIIHELELGDLTPVEIAAILNSLYELLQRRKQQLNVTQSVTPIQPDNTILEGDSVSSPIMGGKRKSFRRKRNKKSLKRRKNKRSLKYKR